MIEIALRQCFAKVLFQANKQGMSTMCPVLQIMTKLPIEVVQLIAERVVAL